MATYHNVKTFPRGSKTEPEKLISSTKTQKGFAKVEKISRSTDVF